MANSLSANQQEEVKNLFLELGSVRAVSKSTGFSRNTVKRLLRAEGFQKAVETVPSGLPSTIHPKELQMLEKLFELGKPHGENLDFEKHIRTTAVAMSKEIGIRGTIDRVRLEGAIFQFIIFRRFYLMSLQASSQKYSGPAARYHEKHVRAVRDWVELSQKAWDQFSRIIRELEIKHGKRQPNFGNANVFVQQNQQINLKVARKPKKEREKLRLLSVPKVT